MATKVVREDHCAYCGWLGWTLRYGHGVIHKHACPWRKDDRCQAHPDGGCSPVEGRGGVSS